jgi:hypothetical protein
MIFVGKSAQNYVCGDEHPPLRPRRIALAVSAALLAMALVLMGH